MNVAVITDIHANLPALETVLEQAGGAGAEEIWCLGDVVGYGASPSECAELVAERCSVVLLGNHDLAVLGEIDISTFSHSAADAVRWTRKHISEEASAWLASIEGSSTVKGELGLFHASPRDPVWEYVVDTETAEDCFDVQPTRVSLIGHSHIALYFRRVDEMSRVIAAAAAGGSVEDLSRGEWLVNPGSVGQPRDGDSRAAWLMVDTETLQASFHRVEYPAEVAAAQIREAGLPNQLGDRLLMGH